MEIGEVENLVAEIEVRLERMRSLYSQYFAGIEKLEPSVVRKDFDRRMEVLRKMQIRNTGLRFRFQMVVQRYNTYQTYWLRICRQIENGTYKRDLRRAKERFESDLPPPLVVQPTALQSDTEAEPVAPAEARPAGGKPADARAAKAPARDGGIFELSDGFDLDLSLDEAFDRVNLAPAPRAAPASAPTSTTGGGRGGAPAPPPLPARANAPAMPPGQRTNAAVIPPPGPGTMSGPPPRISLNSLAAVDVGASARSPGPASPSTAPAAITTMSPTSGAAGGDKAAAKRIVITRSAAPAAARPSGGPPVAPAGGPPVAAPATGGASAPSPLGASAAPPSRDARPAAHASAGGLSAHAASVAPAAAARSGGPFSGGEAAPSRAPAPPAASPPNRAAVGGPPARKDEPGGLPDERVRQIYARYVDTKRANGESTAAVTYDGLAKSLRDSSVKLRDKLGAGKSIDFEVAVKDGKTILKPVLK